MSIDRRRDSAATDAWEALSLAARRIRNAQPEAASAVFATNAADTEPGGCFHYTTLIRNHLQTLTTWRISSDAPSVLGRVVELLGVHAGISGALPDGGVITDATTVDVILSDPSAIDLRWYLSDEHVCDERGECQCPPALSDRRRAARAGRGCEPRVQIRFRLHRGADLGIFALLSGSWSLVKDATAARRTLRKSNGPVVVRLALEERVLTLRSHGRVTYTRPRLIVPRAFTPTIRQQRHEDRP